MKTDTDQWNRVQDPEMGGIWKKRVGGWIWSKYFIHIYENRIMKPIEIIIIILQYWSLNSGSIPWATPPALFCEGLFWVRVPWTVYSGWLWTSILLISATWVIRITGMSHWCPAVKIIFKGRRGIRKSNQGGEFDQSTLYTSMEISQWNSFVQLIHAD
jgi:hypothetical protein